MLHFAGLNDAVQILYAPLFCQCFGCLHSVGLKHVRFTTCIAINDVLLKLLLRQLVDIIVASISFYSNPGLASDCAEGPGNRLQQP